MSPKRTRLTQEPCHDASRSGHLTNAIGQLPPPWRSVLFLNQRRLLGRKNKRNQFVLIQSQTGNIKTCFDNLPASVRRDASKTYQLRIRAQERGTKSNNAYLPCPICIAGELTRPGGGTEPEKEKVEKESRKMGEGVGVRPPSILNPPPSFSCPPVLASSLSFLVYNSQEEE